MPCAIAHDITCICGCGKFLTCLRPRGVKLAGSVRVVRSVLLCLGSEKCIARVVVIESVE